jgi:hypothetical protein
MNDEPLVKQAERSLSGECGARAEEIAREEAEAADEIEATFTRRSGGQLLTQSNSFTRTRTLFPAYRELDDTLRLTDTAAGWRIWKYRSIAKHAAAAAKCFKVCPLTGPPAE